MLTKTRFFIDLHSHHQPNVPGTITVLNIQNDFDKIPTDGYCTAGLHPWLLNEGTSINDFKKLENSAKQKNVIAIGECGLDKLAATSWDLQKTWFGKQIELANRIKKPLIIHCVRSHDEVLSLLETKFNQQPVIFHGFNNSSALALRIIDRGHYLSFGFNLFRDSQKEVFNSIPANRFFLESDDSLMPISAIYTTASKIRLATIESIIEQIHANFATVFGNSIIV